MHGSRSSPSLSGELTVLLRCKDDSKPGKTHNHTMKGHQGNRLTWTGTNPDPPEDGCACCLQFLTHSALHPCNGTFILSSLPELHFVITKPLISLSAPKSLFGIWQSDQFDGLNILKSLSRGLWHYHLDCPPSVTILWQKSFSSFYLEMRGSKSEDWTHAFTQGWRKASTKYSAKQRIQILEMTTDME